MRENTRLEQFCESAKSWRKQRPFFESLAALPVDNLLNSNLRHLNVLNQEVLRQTFQRSLQRRVT